ncbi:9534_t:CDS:2 [Dentiscutata heterogama]|uniref:9534_t:CDS:1 n=1 Tax=Dentiscutata heterogama TaxID=1316150 RepID=A0ACA9LWJ9_9GLOM|nr:9534_t:CDS:2 [Dentiscutata heterogama]
MSDKIFLKSIKVTDENESDGFINLYGQVIVQYSSKDKEKIVIIEYTVNSWDTGDSVTALKSSALPNNQELYYFEISTFKVPNIPLHLEFLARFDVEDSTFWADSSYEYLYDEGCPKEFFFHDATIESTSQNNSTEENSLVLNEERRQLEEELRLLEEERKQYEEERKRRQQEEERRRLEEERKLLEKERRLLRKERMLFEEERRQITRKKDCSKCLKSLEINVFLNITDQCCHDISICRNCVGEHIEREFNKESIKILYSENNRHEDNENVKIKCPEDGCNEILNQKDIKEFASEETFKRYEKFLLNIALSQIDTFQWCLNPNCGSGQDHYQEGAPVMICNSCGKMTCVVHRLLIDVERREEVRGRREEEERIRREEELRRQEEERRRLEILRKNAENPS